MILIIFVLFVVSACSALFLLFYFGPQKSWPESTRAFFFDLFGILIPFLLYLTGLFSYPECLDDVKDPALDCLSAGMGALAPIFIWSTCALRVLELKKPAAPVKLWIVLGIYLGAVTSWFFVLSSVGFFRTYILIFYIPIWYSVRAIQLLKTVRLTIRVYFFTLLGALPVWLSAFIISKKVCANLPQHCPSSCFVVTAASLGHESVVGPSWQILRNGQRLRVNRQLETMWYFESIWSQKLPDSHRIFRRVYNYIGPLVAQQIDSRFKADLMYILIKPFELLICLILKKVHK